MDIPVRAPITDKQMHVAASCMKKKSGEWGRVGGAVTSDVLSREDRVLLGFSRETETGG